MSENILKNNNISLTMQKESTEPKSEDRACTHWGLKHWVYGIKEYIMDRCICCTMCCFTHMDADRAYIDDINGVTTDCVCVGLTPWYGGCLHNNPITGTLCFPLATTMHLLCIFCACCSPTRDDWWIEKLNKDKKEKEEEKLKIFMKKNDEEDKLRAYMMKNCGGENPNNLTHSEYTTLYRKCPNTCTDKNHWSITCGESCIFYKKDEVTLIGMPGVYSYISVYSYPKKYCNYCGKIHKCGEYWERTQRSY